MSLPRFSRRGVLATGLASAAMPRIAFASGQTDKRLVIVLLRGAMDGLTAVPAFGDPDYERARNGIATPRPSAGPGAALDLNGFFGLYPALAGLHARYGRGELVVIHAIAPAMPLMLRGAAPVTSWSPSILPAPSADLVTRIKAMYAAGDPVLAKALDAAADANGVTGGASGSDHTGNALAVLMGAAARFIKAPDGPCLAVVESTGWDTHANQLGPFGVLSRNLAALDQGVSALADGLGPKWADSAVLIVTEFGPRGGDEWHARHRSRHRRRGVPRRRRGQGRARDRRLAGAKAG